MALPVPALAASIAGSPWLSYRHGSVWPLPPLQPHCQPRRAPPRRLPHAASRLAAHLPPAPPSASPTPPLTLSLPSPPPLPCSRCPGYAATWRAASAAAASVRCLYWTGQGPVVAAVQTARACLVSGSSGRGTWDVQGSVALQCSRCSSRWQPEKLLLSLPPRDLQAAVQAVRSELNALVDTPIVAHVDGRRPALAVRLFSREADCLFPHEAVHRCRNG